MSHHVKIKPASNYRAHIAVLGLFMVLTIFMTYPQSIKMNSAVRNHGDPLLNTWIIAWDVHKITTGDIKNLFHTNMFYPHQRTLAFSEHLFTQALIGLPMMLFSKNPILTYNFVLLFSFLISGYGMYLLCVHLIQNQFAGIIAGIIFAFSPFMFDHIGHLQLITAGGIPLSFLFLHRFLNHEKRKHLILFSLFFVLQVLANGYYALYLTLFTGLYFLFHMLLRNRFFDYRFLRKVGLFLAIVTVCTGPFFYQYIAMRNEMGFHRNIEYSADATSYLAANSTNKIYGEITAPFRKQERILFPGLISVVLAAFGLAIHIKNNYESAAEKRKDGIKVSISLKRIIDVAICGYLLLTLYILFSGGFKFSIRISATRLTNPAITMFILIGLRLIIYEPFRKTVIRYLKATNGHIWIYLIILICSISFCFGDKGPYTLLYEYIPGFKGLRVAPRFHIFAMFSLAVLAAFGFDYLTNRMKNATKRIVAFLAMVLILIEYVSIPLPVAAIPVKDGIPEVYKWLRSQKEDAVILELPLFIGLKTWKESPRVYFSSYHHKKMFNGYSGYCPPLYGALRIRLENLPLELNINHLEDLGIRYVILHASEYPPESFKRIESAISKLKNRIRFIKKFGDDYVYEIVNVKQYQHEPKNQSKPQPTYTLLSPKFARVESNINPGLAAKAIDGDITTRWHTGPQKPGTYIQFDLKQTYSISGISMFLGKSYLDYPRGYQIDVSTDGTHWKQVAKEETHHIPLLSYLTPLAFADKVNFREVPARYIRITQTGSDGFYFWSIHELGIHVNDNRKATF